jgi:hypothetical protein
MAAPARKEMREAAWEVSLADKLKESGLSHEELETRPRKQAWKLYLALQLRSETGSSIVWLARRLHLGKATTARGYLYQ